MADRKRISQTMTASSQLLDAARDQAPKNERWQDEAWVFYDSGGELWYAGQWFGNGLSRARLFAAKRPQRPGDEPEPLESGAAVDAVAQLGGGIGGQSRILKSLGVYLTVPGVGYVTASTEDDTTAWRTLSAEELRKGRSKDALGRALGVWEIQTGDNVWTPLPPEHHVIKIWRPHERFHWIPDSPVRHALPVLRELKNATEHIDAALVSRLAGMGLFIYPEEASYPTRPGMPPNVDPLAHDFMAVTEVAINSGASAARRTPLFTKMRSDLIETCRHILFESPLDDKAIKLREDAIRRLATALDMPAEVLLGLGDINHWGQWFIEESGIKYNFQPALELIAHAFTVDYLQPTLEALQAIDEDAIVWFDTSEMTSKPDGSKNALEAYDRLEIDGEALRRELGMAESDLPTDEELRRLAGLKMLSSPLTAIQGLQLLGIDTLGVEAPASALPALPAPSEAEEENVAPELQEPQEAVAASSFDALTAACYVLALRAIEKMGNQARTKFKGFECASEEFYNCLDDGQLKQCERADSTLLWKGLDEIAERFRISPGELQDALAGAVTYCTNKREPLTWEVVATALDRLYVVQSSPAVRDLVQLNEKLATNDRWRSRQALIEDPS